MAIISSGFAGGSMTDVQFGLSANPTRFVESGLQVTQPSTSTRVVSVGTGAAVGYGVRAVNDAAISVGITPPGSGSQYFVIALRFDRGSKTSYLVTTAAQTFGSTTAPTVPYATGGNPGLQNSPASYLDVPLAWVWASSASTTLVIFDLRVISNGSGILRPMYLAGLVLAPYYYPAATQFSMDGASGFGGGTNWSISGANIIPAGGTIRGSSVAQTDLYNYKAAGHPIYLDPLQQFLRTDDGWTLAWDTTNWKVWNSVGNIHNGVFGMQSDVSADSGVGQNEITVRGGVLTWNFAYYSNNQRANNGYFGYINEGYRPLSGSAPGVGRYYDGNYGTVTFVVGTNGGMIAGIKNNNSGGGVNGMSGTISYRIV